jgi:hypothetical protein
MDPHPPTTIAYDTVWLPFCPRGAHWVNYPSTVIAFALIAAGAAFAALWAAARLSCVRPCLRWLGVAPPRHLSCFSPGIFPQCHHGILTSTTTKKTNDRAGPCSRPGTLTAGGRCGQRRCRRAHGRCISPLSPSARCSRSCGSRASHADLAQWARRTATDRGCVLGIWRGWGKRF